MIQTNSDGTVTQVEEMTRSSIRINSGYFVLRPTIFDYMREGEELVREPFQRLIQEGQLIAWEYDGFFHAMDTFKDRQLLEDMYTRRMAPWVVWRDANGRPEIGNPAASVAAPIKQEQKTPAQEKL